MWERVERLLAEAGSETDTAPFQRYLDRLLEERTKMNLTGVGSMAEAVSVHLVDSLEFLRLGPEVRELGEGIDVGSGAGLPGLPIGVALPRVRMTLLESRGKKVEFLEATVEMLRLENVAVLSGRAEDLGRDSKHRERYGFTLVRALAPPPVALEYCLPLVRTGGSSFLWVGPSYDAETAERAAAELGARPGRIHRYTLSRESRRRSIVCFIKESPTPDRYPRRAGIPRKRPLACSAERFPEEGCEVWEALAVGSRGKGAE